MKKREIIRKNIRWILFAISIIIVIAILEDVFAAELLTIDTLAYNLFVEYLRVDWLTSIFKVITIFGDAIVLILISLLALAGLKNKKIGLCIAGNLVLVTLFNLLIKNLVQRPRPEGYRLISESGYSFPSGHSMISTAFYGLIIYFIFKNVKNKKIRNTLCIILGTLIALVGSSRIFLGVHYASDVIAGFFISIAYLMIITILIKRFVMKEERGYYGNK